jgi:hypothetical protein
VAVKLVKLMGKDEGVIKFVKDRPGHDRRYAVDWSKAKNKLGWKPEFDFDIYLTGDKIRANDKEMTLTQLKSEIIKFFKDDIIEEIEYYIDLYQKGVKDSDKKLMEILTVFDQKDLNKFLDYLDSL